MKDHQPHAPSAPGTSPAAPATSAPSAVVDASDAARWSYKSTHDPLTGLINAILLEDRLRHAVQLARRNDRSVAVYSIEIDHFSSLSSDIGQAAADQLIQETARRLRASLRESDTVARRGASSFALMLPEMEGRAAAIRFTEKLQAIIGAPFYIAGRELCISMSIGASLFPDDGGDAKDLLQLADTALEQARSLGHNCCQFYRPDMTVPVSRRVQLLESLGSALANGELHLHYQPQVNHNGDVVGMEALLRWNSPKFGSIGPDQFIPLAEESGLIVPIGTWVLRETCKQNKQWQRSGRPIRTAVNVSVLQFAQPDFVSIVEQALHDYEIDSKWLELELTESLFMHNMQDAVNKLAQLRQMGVGVAIDDFGTGFSSLSYLHRLPLDTLKIPQAFVKDLTSSTQPEDEGRTAVIRAIISLARNLKMNVLAEGVETEQQRDFLLEFGCERMQGFLFAKPATAQESERLLEPAPPPMPIPVPPKLARSA